jgi:hypothetical protein
MKYEIKRRKKLILTVAIIIAFLEAAVCFGIYKGGVWSVISVVFSFVILVGGLLFPFIDAIANLYSDFKNKHGYMLFLTPNKGIKIFGSKAIFALLELLAIVVIVACSLSISLALLKSMRPVIYASVFGDMFNSIETLLVSNDLSVWSIAPFVIAVLLQYFTSIMIAMLSLTISKTILSKNNFNWLFALLIYFAVSFGVQALDASVILGFGYVNNMFNISGLTKELFIEMTNFIYIGSGIYIFWIAVSTTVSSILLSKRTDL